MMRTDAFAKAIRGVAALAFAVLGAGLGEAVAQEARTGSFVVSGTAAGIVGEETAEGLSRFVAPNATIEWEVLVPDAYDPANPPGVLVYISPDDSGEAPAKWKAMLAERNLIWIGANDHGNDFTVARRIGAAILAAARVEQEYKIDPERKYLSGFSGGGRVSSTIAYVFSRAFRGYIFICGVTPQKEPPPRVEDMKQNRYVFLTGSRDFNRVETSRAFEDYGKLGITSAKLMVIGMEHELPRAEHMAKAIHFLDTGEDEQAD